MINIIKNELIKLYYKRKLLFLLIIMSLITFGFILFTNLSSGDNKIQKDLSFLSKLKEQNYNLNDSKEKDDIDNQINKLESSIDYHNKLNDKDFDWKEDLKNRNIILEKSKTNETIDNTNVEIAMNNYLIENNIKPSSSYSINNNDFFSFYLLILGNILLFIIIALTISDSISGEYTNETIQLILLRPIKKFKLLIGKLIANCILILGVVLSFDFIAYILSGLIFGFGNLKTPVLVMSKFTSSNTFNPIYGQFITPIGNTATYMSTGELLLKALFIQILYVLCCICFCTLISTLLRNTITSISISIMFPIACLLFMYSSAFVELKKYFCFIFSFLGDSISIINGSLVTKTGACFLTFHSTILILISWITIFITLIYLSKNRIKIK